jgi:beta-glucosidase
MEGSDRAFGLLDSETQIITDLAATGKPIVGVVNAGGNVEMQGWLPKLSALLWAWYPGQEGGTAIAEVLFGKVNPSGKLPATFEKKWEDNPAFNSYYDTDKDKRVNYSEGIFVGYRGYDKNNTEVQFPFGYGMSYSTFELLGISVLPSKNKDSKVIVSCKVKNTSVVDGTEVVQLYVAKPVNKTPQPLKELKGFEKIFLKAGETKSVSFEVSARDLSYFSVVKNKFVYDAGEYNFMLGTSSRAIKLEKKFVVN